MRPRKVPLAQMCGMPANDAEERTDPRRQNA